MLRPVNNAGLNTCQWGSLGEERVKRVNGATQLTPWRKENWPLWNGLLKCVGHNSGGPTRDMTVRETQNPLWQTECRLRAADRTPWIEEILLLEASTQTDNATCMKYWRQMLLFPETNHAELFFISQLDYGFERSLWAPFTLETDKWTALCKACCKPVDVLKVPMLPVPLGSGRSRCDVCTPPHGLYLRPPVSPSTACKTIHLPLVKTLLPITLTLINTEIKLSPIL